MNIDTILAQLRRGDRAVTEAAHARLSATPPTDLAGLLDLGRLAAALGNEPEAAAWFARAIDADPGNSEGHVELGRSLNRQGRRSEAIQSLCRAVTIDPEAHAALNRLRWLLRDDRLETPAVLSRIKARGLDVASVIDVGASDGGWSLAAKACWPDARYHLVEAFDHWRAKLETLCAREPGFSHVLAAAGAEDGEIWFSNDPTAPYGGAASSGSGEVGWRVPQVALSAEARRAGLKPPYLIKLDTHGFELPILRGAEEILPDTALMVIESYLFHIHPEGVLFHELCAYMAERGFRVADLSEPLWRPLDGALWQMDLFFIRGDRPEFQIDRYE